MALSASNTLVCFKRESSLDEHCPTQRHRNVTRLELKKKSGYKKLNRVSYSSSYSIFVLTPGVGIGIVDLGYERRLAKQLGAHRAPSIIGLLNGRVTFFHQAVVREHLRQFIEDLLPQKLVEKVTVVHTDTGTAVTVVFTTFGIHNTASS